MENGIKLLDELIKIKENYIKDMIEYKICEPDDVQIINEQKEIEILKSSLKFIKGE